MAFSEQSPVGISEKSESQRINYYEKKRKEKRNKRKKKKQPKKTHKPQEKKQDIQLALMPFVPHCLQCVTTGHYQHIGGWTR